MFRQQCFSKAAAYVGTGRDLAQSERIMLDLRP
jgi:hypothetical protein